MGKEDVVHMYNEILLSHKKRMTPFAATWMSLEMITLKKSERERQIPYVTYMWNLKYDTNERL